jgi:hypothetical protein
MGYKGKMCPFAEKTGRTPLVCQEGHCMLCQVWQDFYLGKKFYQGKSEKELKNIEETKKEETNGKRKHN